MITEIIKKFLEWMTVKGNCIIAMPKRQLGRQKSSGFKGVRPVTAKTGWCEGNINRHKTWTPLSPLLKYE